MKNLLILSGLFIFSISSFSQTKATPAGKVLAAAYKEAAEQHKKVLVIFHAGWCGWCRKMDTFINSPECKKLFTDNYIITHLVVHESDNKKQLENEGADALLKQYKAFDSGIPFWVMLDKDGNLLKDSFIKNAAGTAFNIGCPSSEEEVTAFIKILKATSSLSDKELAAISAVFRKNEKK